MLALYQATKFIVWDGESFRACFTKSITAGRLRSIQCVHMELPHCFITMPSLYLRRYCIFLTRNFPGLQELRFLCTLRWMRKAYTCTDGSHTPWVEHNRGTAAWITSNHPTLKSAVWDEEHTGDYNDYQEAWRKYYDSIWYGFANIAAKMKLSTTLLARRSRTQTVNDPDVRPAKSVLLDRFAIRHAGWNTLLTDQGRRSYYCQLRPNSISSEAMAPAALDPVLTSDALIYSGKATNTSVNEVLEAEAHEVHTTSIRDEVQRTEFPKYLRPTIQRSRARYVRRLKANNGRNEWDGPDSDAEPAPTDFGDMYDGSIEVAHGRW